MLPVWGALYQKGTVNATQQTVVPQSEKIGSRASRRVARSVVRHQLFPSHPGLSHQGRGEKLVRGGYLKERPGQPCAASEPGDAEARQNCRTKRSSARLRS